MWNAVFNEHREQFPSCMGFLHWDHNAERKFGLGWTEVAICHTCKYRSCRFKLYEDIKTGKPGRRRATINKSLHYGLSQTPIGPTSFRRVLASSQLPPPSRSGLQKTANTVCQEIKNTNTSDMYIRRQQLKRINVLRGHPENVINIEADGAYNNKLYSGVGKTPYQAGTQCSYVVAENVTTDRQIIAIENVNKLCSKHGFHTSERPTCDLKTGVCSATDNIEASIGNEKQWANRCLTDLKSNHNLEVKHITTDPDTCAYKAAEELHVNQVTETKPVHLIDSRHLTDNHRKSMKTNQQVVKMMPASTKADREKLAGNFALDVSKRCQAEYEKCLETKSKFENVKLDINNIIHAIINCYCGNHSVCELFSKLCTGSDNNWIRNSPYLPPGFQLKPSADNYQTLENCLKYRLSETMLEKTKLNSNSQKVECTNRVLRRSIPTNVTYPRNFDGRAHSAIHSINNGAGESLTKLLHRGGCTVPGGSRVAQTLKSEQQTKCYQKQYQKSDKCKYHRFQRRKILYDMYRRQAEQKHYVKAQLLLDGYARRRLATKVKKTIKSEHSYCHNKK